MHCCARKKGSIHPPTPWEHDLLLPMMDGLSQLRYRGRRCVPHAWQIMSRHLQPPPPKKKWHRYSMEPQICFQSRSPVLNPVSRQATGSLAIIATGSRKEILQSCSEFAGYEDQLLSIFDRRSTQTGWQKQVRSKQEQLDPSTVFVFQSGAKW